MSDLRTALVFAALCISISGCGAAGDTAIEIDADAPMDSELSADDVSELNGKADSDKGPGIALILPKPDNKDRVTVRPSMIPCYSEKIVSGWKVSFECPAITLKAQLTDRGTGIDWATTRVVGQKTNFLGIVLKSMEIKVLEAWKNKDAKTIEVRNYLMGDCRDVTLTNACKIDAIVRVKDSKGAESKKTYDVTIDMDGLPRSADDAICPAPVDATYRCSR